MNIKYGGEETVPSTKSISWLIIGWNNIHLALMTRLKQVRDGDLELNSINAWDICGFNTKFFITCIIWHEVKKVSDTVNNKVKKENIYAQNIKSKRVHSNNITGVFRKSGKQNKSIGLTHQKEERSFHFSTTSNMWYRTQNTKNHLSKQSTQE